MVVFEGADGAGGGVEGRGAGEERGVRGVEEGQEGCAVGLVEVWGEVGTGDSARATMEDNTWGRGGGGHGGCGRW